MNQEEIERIAQKAGWTGLLVTPAEPTGEPDWQPTKARLTVPANAQQLERFVKMIQQAKCNELADQIDRMPFGDTAASFSIWVRGQA